MSQIIINLPYEDKRKFAEIAYKNDITIIECFSITKLHGKICESSRFFVRSDF